jgi:hypothetical protein
MTPAKFKTPTQTLLHPIAPDQHTKCYACGDGCTGVAEKWEGGAMTLVYACKRHTNPTIKIVDVCRYCGDPVRKGSLSLGDGFYAHHRCHAEAERSG